ncbi:MAG: family 16 glycoside hydrolase [Bacteroidales bacterium]
MSHYNFLKGLALIFLISGIVACSSAINDKKIISSGHDQISENWTMKNASASDNYVLLAEDDAAIISKFTARNFDLKMKLKTAGAAEGSLAFHASANSSPKGYSVFINNSGYGSGNIQKTGSLSLIRNFFVHMVNDEEWFDLGLSVRGNHILVTVNGNIVSEYYEPENPLRLAENESMVLSEGSLVLGKSGNDGSILISEISVEGLPDDIPREAVDFDNADDVAEQLTLLNQEGFPLIDYHGHLKNVLSVDEITKHGRDPGFNYGISENCGLNFPVTDDASLNAYYEKIKGEPVFKAMQCEGREWVTFFTPEAIAQFDYVFTDALTFTDHKGRRMRLWIEEEVFVDNEEQFMDMLVEKILAILSQEPVDIYVNPTFLPEIIRHNYDELWTSERMDAVINALVENDIALEINARYEIPGMEFIKRAKASGIKFALGTNNAGADDLGRLEYCIRAIREAGITPDDMFVPRPAGQKKVLSMGLPAITG